MTLAGETAGFGLGWGLAAAVDALGPLCVEGAPLDGGAATTVRTSVSSASSSGGGISRICTGPGTVSGSGGGLAEGEPGAAPVEACVSGVTRGAGAVAVMLASSSSASWAVGSFACGPTAVFDRGAGCAGFAVPLAAVPAFGRGDDAGAAVGFVDVGPIFLSIVVASGDSVVGARAVGGAAADPTAGGARPTTVMRFEVTFRGRGIPGFVGEGTATPARGGGRAAWLSSFAIALVIFGSGAC